MLAAAGGASGELRFRSQEIARDFGVGYAVITADVNSDGRRDIVRGIVVLSSCEKLPHRGGPAERILAVLPGPLRTLVFL